jgi:hypothetical protein
VSSTLLLLHGVVIIVGIGCAGSTRPIAHGAPASLCFISTAEVQRSSASSLYDALSELRPSLLRRNMRGELPIVVLDGAVTSDASTALHGLAPDQVASVRRLSASEATQRYGLHQSNAVLEVRSRRSPNGAESSRGQCG